MRNPEEPTTFKEALKGPAAEKWRGAIDEEWNSLVDEGVFTVVPREDVEGQCVISSKWVFKIKGDGRHKARCVGRGFQQWNSTIDQTFAPVARLGTARMLLALATVFGHDVWQMDVVTAFLNAVLSQDTPIFMEVPQGYEDRYPGMVLRLNKALYGLKEAPRLWNKTFDKFFSDIGYSPTKVDPCLYIRREGEDYMWVIIWVDDILMVGDLRMRQELRAKLMKKFQMSKKVDNKPTELLGMEVQYEQAAGVMELTQSKYTLEVYRNYRDEDVKVRAAKSPMLESTKLTKQDAPQTDEDAKYMKAKDYRGVVGSLLYLQMCTRPDIAFAVKELSRFLDCPGLKHWSAAQHLLEYVKNTHHYGLRYTRPCEGIKLEGLLHGYSDADWAGQVEDRRSTSGYVFKLAGGPISWQSKTQKSVALSTAEAEYMALSDAAKEAMHLRALLTVLGIDVEEKTVIYEDNQAAIKIAENPVLHDRTKHIDIRYHFVRELVEALKIDVVYINTKDMVADLMTKAVSVAIFQRLCGRLMGHSD